jgi:hypothetical protein
VIIGKAVEKALAEKVLDHIRLFDSVQLVGYVRGSCSRSRRPTATPSGLLGACAA